MLSDRGRQALHDIGEHIELAMEFTAGMTLADFTADRRTFYAVKRCLEIVSEASRRLPQELKGRHPAIKWEQMAAAGNFYRHEYSNVEAPLIWDTLQHHLPQLRCAIEAEIQASIK